MTDVVQKAQAAEQGGTFKRRVRVLALLAVLTLTGACASSSSGTSDDASASSTSSEEAAEPIRVGVISNETGANAAYGQLFLRGAKLAFEQLPGGQVAGRPLEFVYYNDGSDPATATSVARRAILQDEVDVLYGQPYTPTALAVAEVAQSMEVVLFNPGSSAEALTSPMQEHVFAGQFASSAWAQAIAGLVCSMDVDTVGMVYQSGAYGEQNLEAMNKFLPECGLKVHKAEAIEAADTSATVQVNSLRAAGADVVVLGTIAEPTIAVLKAMLASGHLVPALSFAGEVPSVNQLLVENPALNFYTVSPLACPVLGACTQEVRDLFALELGLDTVGMFDIQSYAEAQAFLHALEHYAQDPDAGMVAAFETMSPFESKVLAQPIQFSADNHRGVSAASVEGISEGKVTFFGNVIQENRLTEPVPLS